MNSFEKPLPSGEQRRLTEADAYYGYLSEVALANFRMASEAGLMFTASVAAGMPGGIKLLRQQMRTFENEADTAQPPVQALVMAAKIGNMLIDRQLPRLELFRQYSSVTGREVVSYRRAVALNFLEFVTPDASDVSPTDLPWQWQYPSVVEGIVVTQHELLQGGQHAYQPVEHHTAANQDSAEPVKLLTLITADRLPSSS